MRHAQHRQRAKITRVELNHRQLRRQPRIQIRQARVQWQRKPIRRHLNHPSVRAHRLARLREFFEQCMPKTIQRRPRIRAWVKGFIPMRARRNQGIAPIKSAQRIRNPRIRRHQNRRVFIKQRQRIARHTALMGHTEQLNLRRLPRDLHRAAAATAAGAAAFTAAGLFQALLPVRAP